ncbi:MurR/RpiR family transcriptional regulator [Kocuria flava]|uniref:MurR/RpiR family transcriptional regulator n=1 Tax=Kocuria flava TaxID=446860 RepID=UPI0027E31407|nr:MurR/RpiR family transcriptional regulator [Kocuria flava]
MSVSIEQRIHDRYAELSPQEQRAADVLLAHLEDLALYSSAELAAMSGVSRATLSRLYRHLGYESFTEVREVARGLRQQGVPLGPDADPRRSRHLDQELRNLRRALDPSGEQLERAVAVLAAARTVLVVGLRNSHPVALHLRQQLQHARPEVRLAPVPGQTLGEELLDVGPGDAVVLVGFRRRPHGFGALAEACAGTGAQLVLVADGTARRYAGSADLWLECPLDSAGPFDSYAAAMSLVAVLADGVLAAAGEEGRRRVVRAAELYESLAELDLR